MWTEYLEYIMSPKIGLQSAFTLDKKNSQMVRVLVKTIGKSELKVRALHQNATFDKLWAKLIADIAVENNTYNVTANDNTYE